MRGEAPVTLHPRTTPKNALQAAHRVHRHMRVYDAVHGIIEHVEDASIVTVLEKLTELGRLADVMATNYEKRDSVHISENSRLNSSC